MDSATSAISILQFVLNVCNQIQLAKEFENEFELYQLKLNVIQLRLSRWGEVAQLNTIARQSQPTANDGCADPENPTEDPIVVILVELRATVTRAQKVAKRDKDRDGTLSDQSLDADACMPQDLRGVHNRFKGFLNKRRLQTTKAVDGLKWTFYKKDVFDRFIADISYLVTALESLLPESDKQKLLDLSNEECEGINKPNLQDLKDIAMDCDPLMEEAVDEALEAVTKARGGANHITQSHNTGNIMGVNSGRYEVNGTHYWGKG